jgi:hypothetical protein
LKLQSGNSAIIQRMFLTISQRLATKKPNNEIRPRGYSVGTKKVKMAHEQHLY